MPVKFVQHGDFGRTKSFFNKVKRMHNLGVLDKYGREGVIALANATPVDSGVTAASWTYKIRHSDFALAIEWDNNSTTYTGIPIVVLIQYGHGTRNGGYVKGRDFINPTMKPIFDKIADELWKEVTS